MTFLTGGGFTMSPNMEPIAVGGVGSVNEGVNGGALGLKAAAPVSNSEPYASGLARFRPKPAGLKPLPNPVAAAAAAEPEPWPREGVSAATWAGGENGLLLGTKEKEAEGSNLNSAALAFNFGFEADEVVEPGAFIVCSEPQTMLLLDR